MLIHEFKFISMGDEDIVVSVIKDVPPHKGNPSTKSQEFNRRWIIGSSKITNFATLKKYK
jgi:hypothetical protein